MHLDVHKYASLLRQCSKSKELVQGRLLHWELSSTGGYDRDTFLGNLLVGMYGSCGCVQEARGVFDRIRFPNVFSWNMIILAYTQNGHLENARKMFDATPNPNPITWNTIISGYSQEGNVLEARKLFHSMPEQDTVSWNCMIAAYTQNGHFLEALGMYKKMNLEGVQPTCATYVSALHACACLMLLRDGRMLHANIDEQPWLSCLTLVNSIINMYSKCRSLEDARALFYKMPQWNVVSWNIMVAGYAQNGHLQEGSSLFSSMPEKSVVSWNALVNLYIQEGYMDQAKKAFDDMPDKDQVSWNSLLAGFGQNGMVQEAEKLFLQMPIKDLVSWNTIMTAYSQCGLPSLALRHFHLMILEGEHPDRISFFNALSACASFRQVASIHSIVTVSGNNMDSSVATCLLVRYAQCGHMLEARAILERLCQWDLHLCTAMIKGYASAGLLNDAKQLFDEMPERDVVCWTTIIAAYAQQGHLQEAKRMFDEMPERDVVAWNALIGAKAQGGQCREALRYLPLMDLEGAQPDRGTFIVLLNACTNLSCLAAGRSIHANMVGKEFEFDVNIASALIHMYGKCGSVGEAMQVFNAGKGANAVVWGGMLGAFCHNKHGREALELLRLMNLEGVHIDEVAFMSLLSLCCHAGLVKLARQQFVSIAGDYHVTPSMQHYVIMVDLLARTGGLKAAKELMECMPYEPDEVAWTALLAACRLHGEAHLGGLVARKAMQLCPQEAFSYNLLSVVCSQATSVLKEEPSFQRIFRGEQSLRACMLLPPLLVVVCVCLVC